MRPPRNDEHEGASGIVHCSGYDKRLAVIAAEDDPWRSAKRLLNWTRITNQLDFLRVRDADHCGEQGASQGDGAH